VSTVKARNMPDFSAFICYRSNLQRRRHYRERPLASAQVLACHVKSAAAHVAGFECVVAMIPNSRDSRAVEYMSPTRRI